jgi:hypothetical protein
MQQTLLLPYNGKLYSPHSQSVENSGLLQNLYPCQSGSGMYDPPNKNIHTLRAYSYQVVWAE